MDYEDSSSKFWAPEKTCKALTDLENSEQRTLTESILWNSCVEWFKGLLAKQQTHENILWSSSQLNCFILYVSNHSHWGTLLTEQAHKILVTLLLFSDMVLLKWIDSMVVKNQFGYLTIRVGSKESNNVNLWEDSERIKVCSEDEI